ncbi:MAG TPA: GH92 family glycosyl hydrolase [Acidimicrobiales bacterium]|nr:GH92 family glycosyl hydrolase [Acidimicrobiales bacterium]
MGAAVVVAAVGVLVAACGPGTPSSSGAAGTTSTVTRSPTPTVPGSASPASLVDPLMGTGVGGASVGSIDTFPGADVPFGMLQWSPDTSPDRASGGGYSYKDSSITGFSLTHMSGPGCAIYGDIPILPTTGPIARNPATTTATFSHRTEVAHPGSYAVTVGRPGVNVTLSVTTRSGLGRFVYPGTGQENLLFKVADSADGSVHPAFSVVGDDEVEGSVESGSFCDTGGLYQLYFAARFEEPFGAWGTWQGSTVTPGARTTAAADSGGYVSFPAGTDTVEMQVGVSFVSVADALANIDAEETGWDIGALEQHDTTTWNALLGRIAVSGGTVADERTFYSALYKSLLEPNVFDDANGQYMGFDDKVHVATGYTQYSDFSEWDIYRSEIPLLAMLAPRQTSDMVTSLLADASQGGALPKWAVANSDAAQQNGDSADPIIASAYAFGARSFNVTQALADMIRGATDPSATNGTYPERQDLSEYEAKGYVDADVHDVTSLNYTVGGSMTLEYAIDDFAVAQMAQVAGDGTAYPVFMRRAQNWRHEVNPATGYLGARRSDGTFPPGPAFQPSPLPDIGQVGFEEGNAIQYTWSVPQNLHGLFSALGGNRSVVHKLDTFFTKLNTSRKQPYDWAGNEPSLGIPWEYDYAGAPWKTQSVVRRIATTLYAPTPDGEPGNDDLGALSSWYVWAAIGLYPEVPGRAELALASPLFPHVTVSLAGGGSIVLDAPGASPSAPYVHGIEAQGVLASSGPCGRADVSTPAPYSCAWLPASVTMSGATLHVHLASSADTRWASASDEAPPSFPAP